jgi:hypothetical protein
MPNAFHHCRALLNRAQASPRASERRRLYDDALQRLVGEAAEAGLQRLAAGPAGDPLALAEALRVTLGRLADLAGELAAELGASPPPKAVTPD